MSPTPGHHVTHVIRWCRVTQHPHSTGFPDNICPPLLNSHASIHLDSPLPYAREFDFVPWESGTPIAASSKLKLATAPSIHTTNTYDAAAYLEVLRSLPGQKVLTLKRYMHHLTPQCVVFNIARAPRVERIRFRSSDPIAVQVSNMASYVMGRCAGKLWMLPERWLFWSGISHCADGQFR